jgi:peptide/nickel transport system substrate-binding protein
MLATGLSFAAHAADPTHGIAMHGQPRLPEGFPHLPYVNPQAPKGGRITLGMLGTFDSLNPLIIRGIAASGVRDLVIESLMTRSLDEPFTLYGLIAERIEVAADRSAITFHLNPKARFSDTHPITADDVIFSHGLLKDKGRPNLRTYYAKVTNAERLSERAVRFTFAPGEDREIPLILGLMPVLPRHRLSAETFERTSLDAFVGSGPYVIDKIDPGRSITYQRNPDYWGRDLPIMRGRHNVDGLRFDYFRDTASLMEAFKIGEIDLRAEEDPAQWATAYEFPAVAERRVVKTELPIALPAGMSALAFNTRRQMFSDQRVRAALIRLFDFEWTNRNFYHGLTKRTQSFFERSALSSQSRPADATERALLAPFPGAVKPAIMDGTHTFARTDATGRNRDNQHAALALLGEAGYVLRNNRLVDGRGKQLQLEILAATRSQERLLVSYADGLKKLGIDARVRQVDSTQYQARLKTFDFDIIQANWPSSLSPGNEQAFRWSSKAADTEGTFNYPGVKNPAVDAMIEALLGAREDVAFNSAVRALDRVLLSGDYVVPLFHLPKQWVAHWRHLKRPERTSLFGYNLDTWWIEGEK